MLFIPELLKNLSPIAGVKDIDEHMLYPIFVKFCNHSFSSNFTESFLKISLKLTSEKNLCLLISLIVNLEAGFNTNILDNKSLAFKSILSLKVYLHAKMF